jgi:hypothetical protein
MTSWAEFEREAPALAESGRWLLGQNGGVFFLATVRKDGSPQLHPVMPHIIEGELCVFVVAFSSKHRDLERDGRYALHAIPTGPDNREFLVSGRARSERDVAARARAVEATGRDLQDWETLFIFDIEKALGTSWANWGTGQMPWPTFTRWKQGKGVEVDTPAPAGQ